MLTLFHAPQSRSTSVLALLYELDAPCDVEIVDIARARTGTGSKDRRNPHPEGKVPLLVHDGEQIWERAAIMVYLTDLFPDAGLGRSPTDPQRGTYLSWMAYYAGVMEPVLIASAAGIDHPMLHASLRGVPEMTDRLTRALADQPYLLGESYSAADLLLSSPFQWFPDFTRDLPVIRAWVERCAERPALKRAQDHDAALADAA